ncbi:MAG: hypothetical protein ACOC8D_01585 [bacterium]
MAQPLPKRPRRTACPIPSPRRGRLTAGRDFGFWEAVAVWQVGPGLAVAMVAPKGVA